MAQPTYAAEVIGVEPDNSSNSDRQILARFKPVSAVSRALTGTSSSLDSKAVSLGIPGLEMLRNMRFEENKSGFRSATPSASNGFDISVIKITDQALSIEQAIERLVASGQVEYAEPDYPLSIDALPNDPSFANLYGLHNTGQSGGTVDADIDAPEAWDVSTGSSNIIVAVIDTGVQYDHPDLSANMWVNPGEIAGDGLDNDNNGYVDDIFGIDTANDDGDPMDDNSHGTHVAGTIGAVGNNSAGVAGVNWNVSIMALKYLDNTGNGATSDAIELLNYIHNMKTNHGVDVRISNNSWGGGGFSQSLYDAIAQNEADGVLFVAAAGNDGTDNDSLPHYPSSYNLDSIIAVAATDDNDDAYGDSFGATNYGLTSVDLAAPGVSIYSTLPGSSYGFKTGTSMATPQVAGAAALILANNPLLNITQLKDLLLNSSDQVASMNGITLSGGRLNVYEALTCSTGTNPKMYTRTPPDNSIAGLGENTLFEVRVSDCGSAVLNAVVNVTPDNGDPVFNLLDDGIAPDALAGDGVYSGNWLASTVGSANLAIQANNTGAPGTLNAQRTLSVVYIPGYTADATYPYAWIDVSDGTDLGLGNQDDADLPIPIGFDFNFYGTLYSDVWVHTNGLLKFGSANELSFFEFLTIPDTMEPNNFIAPFWEDLNPMVSSGGLYSKLQGSAPNRRLIVQWHNLKHFKEVEPGGPSGEVSFQAILYEGSNDIVIQYLDTTFDDPLFDQGARALTGIEYLDGSRGLEYANQAGGLNEQVAILYSPDSSTKKVLTLDLSSVGGNIADNAIPAQLNCPQVCYGQYDTNDIVTLNAIPDTGYSFVGWSGAGCSGTGACVVTMDAHKHVQASFVILPEIQIIPESGLNTTEAGGSASFTMTLTTQPASDVTIALSSSDLTEGHIAPASVTFTAVDWNQPHEVVINGQDDEVDDGDFAYTIITDAAVSGDPDYDGMNPTDVSVSNVDNDTAGISITQLSVLETQEAGGNALFSVVLDSLPEADVTLALSSSDTSEGSLDKTTLLFTPVDGKIAQIVTISGIDDQVMDGDINYNIVIQPSVSSDLLYDGIDPPDLGISNIDNDVAGITITPLIGLETTEDGGVAQFSVVLDSLPTGDVSLTLQSDDTDEGIIDKTLLTFTPADGLDVQFVAITGIDDPFIDGDMAYSIITNLSSSSDINYDAIDPPDISVSNIDNDFAIVHVFPQSGLVTTEAGGSDTFEVWLENAPESNVSINFSSSNSDEALANPASLTFEPGNATVHQSITVTGVDDFKDDGEMVFQIISSNAVSDDSNYSNLSVVDVSGINLDDDIDSDNDEVIDSQDNCPGTPNAAQIDTDLDGMGDECDADDDEDTIADAEDNCPLDENTAQKDTDQDDLGDACDPDVDNDGILNDDDSDPIDPALCIDTDADSCDDCSIGSDGIGPLDDADPYNDGPDNESDGLCDAGDPDDDNDGILDAAPDNCPFVSNVSQVDDDNDGIGNACEVASEQNRTMCFPIVVPNGRVMSICL